MFVGTLVECIVFTVFIFDPSIIKINVHEWRRCRVTSFPTYAIDAAKTNPSMTPTPETPAIMTAKGIPIQMPTQIHAKVSKKGYC